jgi:hypothetical protein
MGLKKICGRCQSEIEETDCIVSGAAHGICPDCLWNSRAKSVLRKEHLDIGLSLEEDDHVIELKKEGHPVAWFTTQADKEEILEKADEQLR